MRPSIHRLYFCMSHRLQVTADIHNNPEVRLLLLVLQSVEHFIFWCLYIRCTSCDSNHNIVVSHPRITQSQLLCCLPLKLGKPQNIIDTTALIQTDPNTTSFCFNFVCYRYYINTLSGVKLVSILHNAHCL